MDNIYAFINPIIIQELKYRPWTADYKPPAPPDENSNVKKTPEEIEREIKVMSCLLCSQFTLSVCKTSILFSLFNKPTSLISGNK